MTFKDFRKACCDYWTRVRITITLPTYDGGSDGTFLFHYPWNADAEKRGADQPMMPIECVPHEFDMFHVDRFGPYYTSLNGRRIQDGLYVSLSIPIKEEG